MMTFEIIPNPEQLRQRIRLAYQPGLRGIRARAEINTWILEGAIDYRRIPQELRPGRRPQRFDTYQVREWIRWAELPPPEGHYWKAVVLIGIRNGLVSRKLVPPEMLLDREAERSWFDRIMRHENLIASGAIQRVRLRRFDRE